MSQGLTALWILNEGGGFPWDAATQTQASLGAGVLAWEATRAGMALGFNAAASINTGRDISFGTGDFTVEAWFISTNPGVFEIIVGKDTNTGRDWNLNCAGVTLNRLSVTSNVTGASATGATTIVSGRLYHVVATRLATTMTLYLDGLEDGTVGGVTDNFNAVSPIFLGARQYPANEQFMTGRVSYVAIWQGRALSATDVMARSARPYAFLREKTPRTYSFGKPAAAASGKPARYYATQMSA
jgi:hypothetical protein